MEKITTLYVLVFNVIFIFLYWKQNAVSSNKNHSQMFFMFNIQPFEMIFWTSEIETK